mgnify:CR=1 FL=1
MGDLTMIGDKQHNAVNKVSLLMTNRLLLDLLEQPQVLRSSEHIIYMCDYAVLKYLRAVTKLNSLNGHRQNLINELVFNSL